MNAVTVGEILASLPEETQRRLEDKHVVYATDTVLIVATPGVSATATLVNLDGPGGLRIAAVIEIAEVGA